MKNVTLFLLAALAMGILSGCQDLDPRPAFPTSEATLALRAKYNDKVVGTWTYETLTDTAKNLRLYEQYQFNADGTMSGMVRWGGNDSIASTWSNCTVSAQGEYCSPKQTHNFRYIANDTIVGTWELVAGNDGTENYLVIEALSHTAKEEEKGHYDSFLDLSFNSTRTLHYCNGAQLFISDFLKHEAQFTKGTASPSF